MAHTPSPDPQGTAQGPIPFFDLYANCEPPIPITLLKAFGLRQRDIARLLGVTKGAISQWISGTREIPMLVLVDLWELCRVVEERMNAGADVHAAVEGWSPTVILTPKGRLQNPHADDSGGGPTITSGMDFPVSAAWEEAAARRDVQRMEHEGLRSALHLLAAEQGQPLTAERLMRIRRLAIGVKLTAETSLMLLGGVGIGDASDHGDVQAASEIGTPQRTPTGAPTRRNGKPRPSGKADET